MTKAKFYVSSLKQVKMGQNSQIGTLIELLPVMSGSKENEEFYQYTPSGKVELGIVNEESAKEFEIGKEYYVEFTKVV